MTTIIAVWDATKGWKSGTKSGSAEDLCDGDRAQLDRLSVELEVQGISSRRAYPKERYVMIYPLRAVPC
jgi:hypothetical protein